jgi:hypothetical protein
MPDELGEWLLIPAKAEAPPALRAYVPRDKSSHFANGPAIDWLGSLDAATVQSVAKKSLTILPHEVSECRCEIWSDEPTPEEPGVFTVETVDQIFGYVADWLSRANVSLSIQRRGIHHPLLYIWGTLREAGGTEPADEVGIKYHRCLLGDGHLWEDVVNPLFNETKAPSIGNSINIEEFFSNVKRSALG